MNAQNFKICQCCGMPRSEEKLISREPDGSLNEEYCKWCYADGMFTYESKDKLIDFMVSHMPNPENASDEERRNTFGSYLSQLNYWKNKCLTVIRAHCLSKYFIKCFRCFWINIW